MQLNKQLILFRYILKQFGYEEFESLREEFNNKQTGTSSSGHTFFAGALLGNANKLIEDRALQEYDEIIQEYEKKLRENRAEPFFSFKYYQWFALLFTEYFFDSYSTNSKLLLDKLNEYLLSNNDFRKIDNYTESDLKKIAYWMATGSGKTLIMHCNYWQITKYFNDWENIILITPNEGLSRQHYESFLSSGIPAKLYSGSEESLKTNDGEVLILEITKLVKEKEGQGVSVDVDYFSESRNLVFIDEGHKGQKSTERAWKNLREHLTRSDDSFTFEYSATFGQIINNSTKDLLQEYGKAIIFDYSYRHFYTDGYGKDFAVFNLDVKNDYSEKQNKLLLSASLLGFYEQLELFNKYKNELKKFNIEKPLWVFVGSRVIGSGTTKSDKETVSDVSRIVKFAKQVLSNPEELQTDINNILDDKSGLMNAAGEDVFKDSFKYLRENNPIAEDILNKVFNGIGNIEAFQIKQAEGEIALKTKTSDKYFAVINIGDVPKYSKTLEADTNGELIIQEDNFTKSLFHAIAKPDSSINILIGSKKFIEGWNSWRVSSMGLMNMGKNEGTQIIQLFGRGVRLKGKELSLKREDSNAAYYIKALQTISIMGLNASYMNSFLKEIEKEVPDYIEYPIKIKLNREGKWNSKILTFKKETDKKFNEFIIELVYERKIARRITIDLRNKVSVATGGFNSQIADRTEDYIVGNLLDSFGNFINFDDLVLEANRYKMVKNYRNLIINSGTIYELIKENSYNLYSDKNQLDLSDAICGKIQKIAINIVKDYINKFYAEKEKTFLSKYLTYEMLEYSKHEDMFPANGDMIVKIPREHESIIDELEENIEQLYEADNKILPTIHFDKHLYSPIISIAKGNKYKEIKTVPVRLNEGERNFVKHIREHIREMPDKFADKEIFLLRNLSMKGVGFFMESSSFYPDFILWIVDGNKQHIFFLDPKGILLGDTNFNNSKVLWCKNNVFELEKKIKSDLVKNNSEISVSISAYILSVTSFDKVRKVWSNGNVTQEDFTNNKILFIKNNKAYLEKIFENIFVQNANPHR